MAREYRHIEGYEEVIMQMREEGKSRQEIGDILGLSKVQIKNFINRYNRKQQKMAAGIPIKPKGRPRKDGFTLPASIQRLSKITQLQYEIARKDTKIKLLEMENELMRDFLSLTGRK